MCVVSYNMVGLFLDTARVAKRNAKVFGIFFSSEEEQTLIHVWCVSVSNIYVSEPICAV